MRRLLSLLLFSTAACAATPRPPTAFPAEGWRSPLAAEHPLVGHIYDVKQQQFISRADLERRLVGADWILLGEKHDNPDHHRLQAELIDAVAHAGRQPAAVFEMIEESKQASVDAWLIQTSTDVDALAGVLDWAHSGWPAWPMYRPVFAAALAGQLPIIAAMLPRSRAMEIARGKEKLPEAFVERHGLDQALPPELQEGLLQNLREGHCGQLPDSMVEPMVTIQRARDALMADKMLDAGAPGAILIAGGGHARSDRGVPWYLRRLDTRPVLSLGFTEVDDTSVEPADYVAQYGGAEIPFDVIWFTPRANDKDYCAELRQQLKHHGKHGTKK